MTLLSIASKFAMLIRCDRVNSEFSLTDDDHVRLLEIRIELSSGGGKSKPVRLTEGVE